MTRRAAVGTLAVLATLVAARLVEAGPWVRVQSAHFAVSANVGEKRAREVATRLEQFRWALLRMFPDARLSVRPLFVVAFDSEQAYSGFKPLHHPNPSALAGYFIWNSDGHCVALQLDRGDESYPIVFHEYAHLFLSGASRHLPAWLDEGVAEYYSTTEVANQGREANVGLPVDRHVQLLRRRELMPLRSLVTAADASKVWDTEDARLFYAESWALVHYLAAQPGGAARLNAFAERASRGSAGLSVFEETFGPLARVETDFRRYLQNAIYRYVKVRFLDPVDAPVASARAMSAAEVDTVAAVVLIYLGRYEEAATRVGAAVNAEPDLVDAHVALGLLARRQNRPADAERAFRAAVSRGPGHLDAAYYWGLSLVETAQVDAASLDRARAALAAALPADDPPADALAVLGILHAQCNRLEEAEAMLRRSMQLMPGQTRTSAGLADVLTRREKFDEARTLLTPMIEKPSYEGEADIGRRLLKWLSEVEMRAKLRDELALISHPPTRAEAAQTGPAAAPGGPSPLASRSTPVYRVVRPGEQHQLGLLQQIECGPHGIVMQLKTSAGGMRFHAPRFEDVQFVTYRDDLGGSIGCGARPNAEAILLTWRPAGETLPTALGRIAGTAVAVEFLPKD